MSSYTPKLADIENNWHLVDAQGQTLGRLASNIAFRLQGKHKPTYAPYLDGGDYIVVVNCSDIKVTGKKEQDKIYHRHTGYPGGIKSPNYAEVTDKHPTKPLMLAVKRMLPRGPMGRKMLTKLRLFAGPEHGHAAQMPQALSFDKKEKN